MGMRDTPSCANPFYPVSLRDSSLAMLEHKRPNRNQISLTAHAFFRPARIRPWDRVPARGLLCTPAFDMNCREERGKYIALTGQRAMSTHSKNRPVRSAQDAGGQGLSTGSLALDLKLGTGGWPRGRIVELFGASGSGRTTLLLQAIARSQAAGGFGAFIDADHGTDPSSAERLGVDLESMPFHRTNGLEDAFEKIEELALGGAVHLIALDSIAALLPEGSRTCRDISSAKSEEHQHRIDHFLKALLGPLARSRAVLLITNQVREKAGVFFGNPETTPWPTLPLRDYASQRVELRRAVTIKDGEEAVGIEVKARILKNRFAAPLGQVEFPLLFASGIDTEAELLGLGLESRVLDKRGAFVFLDDVNLGKGQGEAVRRLRQDAELATRLREGITARLGPQVGPSSEEKEP
jgi:recombination protein RecA